MRARRGHASFFGEKCAEVRQNEQTSLILSLRTQNMDSPCIWAFVVLIIFNIMVGNISPSTTYEISCITPKWYKVTASSKPFPQRDSRGGPDQLSHCVVWELHHFRWQDPTVNSWEYYQGLFTHHRHLLGYQYYGWPILPLSKTLLPSRKGV